MFRTRERWQFFCYLDSGASSGQDRALGSPEGVSSGQIRPRITPWSRCSIQRDGSRPWGNSAGVSGHAWCTRCGRYRGRQYPRIVTSFRHWILAWRYFSQTDGHRPKHGWNSRPFTFTFVFVLFLNSNYVTELTFLDATYARCGVRADATVPTQ